MKLLFITLDPLVPSSTDIALPFQALPAFRAAGHELFVAAPLHDTANAVRQALGVQGVLPLFHGAPDNPLAYLANLYRVTHWARQWRPELYLSWGGLAAVMAHSGRGATGGHGLALLLLPSLRHQRAGGVAAWLERRAVLECDRLLAYDEATARTVVERYHARGGDISILAPPTPAAVAAKCEEILAEPPGFD